MELKLVVWCLALELPKLNPAQFFRIVSNYCVPSKHNTVPLKCNIALARMYFPQISMLDTLLSTSTRTNSTRIERGVEADVKDSIG